MARRMLGLAAGVVAGVVMLTASADAAVWQVAPSASPNPYKNFLTAVARVPGTSQFWAAGYTLDQAGPAHSLIETSSGAGFSVSPIPRMGRFEQLLGVAAASPAHAWPSAAASCTPRCRSSSCGTAAPGGALPRRFRAAPPAPRS